jgi:galactokinase
VAGISRIYRKFSSGQGKKRDAIVVNNKSLDALLINMSEKDIVAVEITHGNKTFTAVSIYLDSGKDITDDFN